MRLRETKIDDRRRKSGLFGVGISDAATAKAAFVSAFKEICASAGITRCREGTDQDNTVENFLENNISVNDPSKKHV